MRHNLRDYKDAKRNKILRVHEVTTPPAEKVAGGQAVQEPPP